MVRALLLVLAMAGMASAQPPLYDRPGGGSHLFVTLTGTESHSVTVHGSKSAGGYVTVDDGGNYPFGANSTTDITVVVYWEDRPYCDGLSLNYADHATVADSNALKFHVYGCSGSNSCDSICTGGAADYVQAYGGTNAIATGHGNDFIDTAGDSYVFSGSGGAPWGSPDAWGDTIFWTGTSCVVYTADSTQGAGLGVDYISPRYGEDDELVPGLTVHDSGPLTGWN